MKAAFHTLGCKVNSFESQAVLEEFSAAGFDIVDFSEFADVYVINSCSVTGMAEHKSRQMMHRARKINPAAIIVATGCYAQRCPENLAECADVIVGNNRKNEILEKVLEYLGKYSDGKGAENCQEVEPEILVSDLTRCTTYEEQTISSLGDNVRCYVKIQDGCNRFCSYCIIPYVRGRSRVRKEEDILREVTKLAGNGFKEIVLTGIDISMYEGLENLIEKIDKISGIERIRLGSLELSVITDEFVEKVSKCRSFCPQFHLSLQSGCNETLKRMNRHYTTEEYEKKVNLLRETFPLCGITTDVIVGFAGETEEEFAESLAFVKKMKFTQTHVFKYSRRQGTIADKYKNQVPENIKNQRSEMMIAEASAIKKAFEESLIGKTHQVLLEEVITLTDGRRAVVGFTPEYIKIALLVNEQEDGNRLVNQIKELTPVEFAENADGRILAAWA